MTTKPFYQVIECLTGYEVIPFIDIKADLPVIIDTLQRLAETVADDIKLNPIKRLRANEAGIDIKERVSNGLEAEETVNFVPMTRGYPDFTICITNKIFFLACKTFRSDQINESLRSFYYSDGPSIRKNIDCAAAHILMSFEMQNQGNLYTPLSYRLVDLYDLPCTLKKEWNSSNTKLYAEGRVLVNEIV